MSHSTPTGSPVAVLPPPTGPPEQEGDPPLLTAVRALTDNLFEPGPGWTQEQRVALLAGLETLKNACAGTQAVVTLDLDEQAARAREATQGELGHARRERAGVTTEVSLARKVAPVRSRNLIDLAKALSARLPHTQEALRHGRLSEWGATIVAKVTKDLSDEDAGTVDSRLAPLLGTCSEAQLEKKATALVYEIDKRGFLERAQKSTEDRYVSIRPAPDGMVRVSALIPLAEGVAAWASLDKAASAQKASGATFTKTQLRADEFTRRLTAIDPTTCGVPVEIGLVMTDRSLFDDGDQSARVPGFGAVPASVARMLAAYGPTRPETAERLHEDGTAAKRAATWVRRLFTDPVDGSLSQMDTRRRLFSSAARRFIIARDQECAMPYCTAIIRSIDHINRARDQGPTSMDNGQGMCEACNLDKETEDLVTTVATGSDGRRTVRFRTRYGQTHHTDSPPVLQTLTDLTAGWHGSRPPWWQVDDDVDEALDLEDAAMWDGWDPAEDDGDWGEPTAGESA